MLQAAFERRAPPRVKALHLPPPPPPGGRRGEFCALELQDGTLGLSYVLLDATWAALAAQPSCLPQAGDEVWPLAQGWCAPEPWRQALGLAAVNALTRCVFDRAGFVPPASADSMGHLDLQPGETLGMVGWFAPLLPRLRARGVKVVVVELRPELVGEEEGVRITLDRTALAGCDQVLATGTLLLNHTLSAMLAPCRQARRFALIGPSVGVPPDPLLARGVSLLGGSWVVEGPAALQALRSGQALGAAARKFALTAQDYPGWPALMARGG
ncbi:hypothetical protein G3A44_11160 [Ideonella sp. TBM-1]|uniref:Uncharacterized protein n=2 Tax=Ideonella livida TaxID=2707176 RepID=A0A7C9TL43_9BURK|nr:hypothetical protein [Ideonella livida]